MFTITAFVNACPIFTRTAVNVGEVPGTYTGICRYKIDDGTVIEHNPKDGGVVLAIKMMAGIHEQGVNDPKVIQREAKKALRRVVRPEKKTGTA